MIQGTDLYPSVVEWANQRGLNLLGAADAGTFDCAQPAGRRAKDLYSSCGTILLVGAGGRHNWRYLLNTRNADALKSADRDRHPIDEWSRDIAQQILVWMRIAGHEGTVVLPNDRRSLNFVQLGEAAGLGTISPVIHQLIHPEFGPWVTLRAAILLHGKPFGDVARLVDASFNPCEPCDRPCVKACPTEVYGPAVAPGFAATCGTQPDVSACATRRLAGGCATGCDVRRACHVGVEHRFGADEESFRHNHSLFMMQSYASSRNWRERIANAMWRRRRD